MDSRESQKSLVAAASAPILRKLYGDWIDREAAARSVPFVKPREAFARAFDKACKSLREAGFEPESGIKISSFPRDPKTFPGWLAGEWRVQAGRRPSLVAVLYGLDAVLAGTETELHRAWQKDDAVSRKRWVRAPRQPIETDSVPLADETAAAALGAHLASILSDELKGAQEHHAPQAVLRAIAKVFERAIRETIVGMQIETLSPRNDDADQVRTILVTMFSHPAAAAAIVDMVLLEDCEPARVALIAAAAGHDDTTMPFRWRSFLSQFLAAFERHAHTEADTLESPLHQQFSGPAFFQLRCNVAALIETVDGVVGRLTGGLAELDPTLHNRGFFLEYLGRNGHPKPFGGRSAEIALLNDWLYDPEDRPNLLLVAPAGRGKSALLVHWARQLPPDIGVVFVPVSLRFQTAQPMNFIPALAWGLGRLHGQIPDLSLSRDLSACRSLSASLMRKELKSYRFLVIIVDGLDEAGSLHSWAGQFSDDLASNVRIIVAARQIAGDEDGRRWMQNLCWDTSRVRPIRLGGLKRDGVGQVLRDMALPASYTTEDMIGVLHHLSQGDPLLVGLYAEQMLEQSREQGDAAWTIEDLRRLSPGITSFFERWLADQVRLWGGNHPLEETRVRGCLAVLAHALGPILAVELRAMMTRAYGLSDWTLRATIDALARFVIGDGLTHGYALTHPRLNEFFASETFVGFEERRRVLDSFVRWGEETLNGLDAGKLDPSRTPHYLLHHLGDHLVQAEAGLPQQMRLLGPGWIRSWGTVDPTWRGLLGDVQRSWASARRLTSVSAAAGEALGLSEQIRCLLICGSVHSPHQPIPAEVLNGALETKQLTPSQILSILAYDTERSDFHERIEKVANASAPACGIALAELADLREASLPKVRALARIAEGLRGTDRIIALDKAKRAARECHETFDRLCAAALVQRFSRTDRQSAARRIAAGLNACRARRCIPADVIVALAATSREIAGDFAHECIERSFVLSAFALDPSARQVFNLLPEEKRSEFIERATRSILEGTDNDHRNFIEVIEPHLDEVKRTALMAKFRTQGIADEAVVLSRFDRLGPDEAADLAARLKEALLTKSGSLQEYSVVRWSGLLRHLTRDQRGALVAILLHEIALPIGSGQWTDLICDILPWLEQEERKGAIAAVLDQGRQHFDQVPTFVALGKGLQFLPTALRDPASRRLSKRINDYVQDRPMTGDPRRIQLALELLDQMDEANASTLARILFDAKQSQGHINVVTLGRIMPWLTGSRRETACDQIREWARTIPWSVVDVSSLIAVRHWLSEDDAQATINRFYQAAERDADDRLIARNLAYFLPLNEGEERTRLAGRLLDMASRTAEWDHSWFQVVEMIVRECDVLWLLAEVRSFITSLGLSNPHAAARLLVLLASRAGPGKGTELIEEALALHPYRAWPLDMVIESIPLLPRPVQADVLTEALRELSTEKRVGQFRALEALFPTLAALGGQDTIAAVWECIWEVTQLWS